MRKTTRAIVLAVALAALSSGTALACSHNKTVQQSLPTTTAQTPMPSAGSSSGG